MTKFLFALSLGFGGLIWATQNAFASDPTCLKRGEIVERLQTKYGETRRNAGLGRNNGMVEVFASSQTGTWTILVTLPNGMSCLIAAGQAWEDFEEVEIVPGDDA